MLYGWRININLENQTLKISDVKVMRFFTEIQFSFGDQNLKFWPYSTFTVHWKINNFHFHSLLGVTFNIISFMPWANFIFLIG